MIDSGKLGRIHAKRMIRYTRRHPINRYRRRMAFLILCGKKRR